MSSTNLPINFRLEGIKTEEFAIIEESFNEQDTSLSYSLNTNIGIVKQGKIVCSIGWKFIQKDIPFIKICVMCVFGIEKKSWNNVVDIEKNQITLPKDFVDHIVVLTLGTLRGVLHAKTEGTKFSRFFVPTINVAELSKDIKTLTLPIQDD